MRQPTLLDNIFQLSPQETVQKVYECDDTCLGFGKKYSTALTNARIIHREKEVQCCCDCSKHDSMLFLSDISLMEQGMETSCRLCGWTDLLACVFTLGLCCFCRLGCCKRGFPITMRGSFGSHTVKLDTSQAVQALNDFPHAALPHKVNSSSPATAATTFSIPMSGGGVDRLEING